MKRKISILAAVLLCGVCCMNMQHAGMAGAEETIEVTKDFGVDEQPVMEEEYQKDGTVYELVSQEEEELTKKEEEAVRKEKKLQLPSDDISLIPESMEYVKDGVPAELKLDKKHIVMKEAEKEKREKEQLLDKTVVYDSLPDNDIDRLEKHITHKGKTLDLISVDYSVEKRKNGIPISYAAACYYACVVTQEEEVPTVWEARVWYEGVWSREVAGGMRVTAVYKEKQKEEVTPAPAPEKEEPEKKEQKKVKQKKAPLAAAPAAFIVVAAGIFCLPNVKVYRLGENQVYKKIAAVRAGKRQDGWHLQVKKAAAKSGTYKIVCSKKLLKKPADFYINGRKIPSPDGKGESVFCL